MTGTLESHVLGFVLRQQLIHEVRREYEGLVDSIQSPELLQRVPLPLANETINWPHQNILCLPLFASREGELCQASCHSTSDDNTVLQSPRQRSGDGDQKADPLQSPLAAANLPTSTPNHSPQSLRITEDASINSQADCRAHRIDKRFEESSLNCLIEPLPRHKEALLELRSQLTLELLWIKQAIASRQDYLQLKKQIQSKHSATE